MSKIERYYLVKEPTELEARKIRSSEDAYKTLQGIYDDKLVTVREEFVILFLNNANKVVGWKRLAEGGMTGCVVDIRLLMAAVLTAGAVAIIISHNHPSGTLKPSEADIRITKKIQEACEVFDIRLLDHIIYTLSDYHSFGDNGLL